MVGARKVAADLDCLMGNGMSGNAIGIKEGLSDKSTIMMERAVIWRRLTATAPRGLIDRHNPSRAQEAGRNYVHTTRL